METSTKSAKLRSKGALPPLNTSDGGRCDVHFKPPSAVRQCRKRTPLDLNESSGITHRSTRLEHRVNDLIQDWKARKAEMRRRKRRRSVVEVVG